MIFLIFLFFFFFIDGSRQLWPGGSSGEMYQERGRVLDIGDYKTCAVLRGHRLKCWGAVQSGHLGIPIPGSELDTIFSPADLPDVDLGDQALFVSAGYKHTCALLQHGLGVGGRLGYGHQESLGMNEKTVPSVVGNVQLGVVRVTQIACGTATTCAVHSDGKLRCWGLGYGGVLGFGNTQSWGEAPERLPEAGQDTPVGAPVLQLALAGHACAVVDSGVGSKMGKVRCWGLNGSGQCGLGHTTNVGDSPEHRLDGGRLVDVSLGVGRFAKHVDVGLYHSCALLAGEHDGQVMCWGSNEFGQLGYGRYDHVGVRPDFLPVHAGFVPLPPDAGRVVQLSTGAWHTCLLFEDGTVRCFGRGEEHSGPAGALGYGDDFHRGPHGYRNVSVAELPPVPLGTRARLVRCGRGHTCVVTQAGALRCFGWGQFGALGYGSRRSVGHTKDDLPAAAGDVKLGGVIEVSADTMCDSAVCLQGESSNDPYGRRSVASSPWSLTPPAHWISPHTALVLQWSFLGFLLACVFLIFRKRRQTMTTKLD